MIRTIEREQCRAMSTLEQIHDITRNGLFTVIQVWTPFESPHPDFRACWNARMECSTVRQFTENALVGSQAFQ